MRVRAQLAGILILWTVLACAPKVSVPIGEIVPDDSVAPALTPGDWRVAADRDRAARTLPVVITREAPIVGAHAQAILPATTTVRYLDFDDITTELVSAPPSVDMLAYERGPVVLRVQVLLDRANYSVGAIDGHFGKNTAIAVYWFQYSQHLPATGIVDADTYNRLASVAGTDHVVAPFVVDHVALDGPFVSIPHNVYAQASLRCLCYSSPLELLAERFHTTPEVLQKLNPKVAFGALAVGDVIWAPSVEKPLDAQRKPIVRIHVSKSGNYVHALAADGSIVFHFPSTLGSMYDPSPDGNFEVTLIALNPTFTYDPTLFSDVPDTKPKAQLPPGPNSPVGTVWIALSKEHVGIHGTPTPETIGSASSHGCVRLTNWDAEKLAESTVEGTQVEFVQ